jgi:hypothetical protein
MLYTHSACGLYKSRSTEHTVDKTQMIICPANVRGKDPTPGLLQSIRLISLYRFKNNFIIIQTRIELNTQFQFPPSHQNRILAGILVGVITWKWQANRWNGFGISDGRVQCQKSDVVCLKTRINWTKCLNDVSLFSPWSLCWIHCELQCDWSFWSPERRSTCFSRLRWCGSRDLQSFAKFAKWKFCLKCNNTYFESTGKYWIAYIYLSTQWAAVRILLGLIKDPPQNIKSLNLNATY